MMTVLYLHGFISLVLVAALFSLCKPLATFDSFVLLHLHHFY